MTSILTDRLLIARHNTNGSAAYTTIYLCYTIALAGPSENYGLHCRKRQQSFCYHTWFISIKLYQSMSNYYNHRAEQKRSEDQRPKSFTWLFM